MKRQSRTVRWMTIVGAIVVSASLTGSLSAQTTAQTTSMGSSYVGPIAPPPQAVMSATNSFAPLTGNGDNVEQAGCRSCGAGLLGNPAPDLGAAVGGCSSCGAGGCASGGCNGRKPCDCCCDSDSAIGRLFCGFYQCVCCPDPCYEPHWNALADTAFFQDAARPVTQLNLGYDNVWNYPFPDKAEYLFARADGHGKGPKPLGPGSGHDVSYRDLMMYSEVGIDRFSASFEIPYLQVSPDNYPGASGMGDLVIGTKSMLLDCELMQFTFGFKTMVPTGDFTKGLGTGHVSLEPSLIAAIKLAPETYLQTQLAYRFPLGGDGAYQGPVLHYHIALNQQLWSCGNGIKVIGTVELNGYEILGGAYTDTDTGMTLSAKDIGDIVNIGPGVRLVFCDKIDFGIGSAFNFTSSSMGDEYLKVAFRWRF